MELRTDRLVLRDLTEADEGDVHAWASDPRIATYVAWGPNTAQDTRQYLADCLAQQRDEPREEWNLGIVLDGRVVGSVELHLGGWESASVGYVLHPDLWGQGIVGEAFAELVRFAFEDMRLHRLHATCRPENAASARVLERAGFRLEGRLRDHLRIRGEWQDSLLYARLVTDPGPETR